MELKIGTKLLFTTKNSKIINTIIRETPTLWVTDKFEKIRKSDNSIYGENSKRYRVKTYKLLTNDDVEMLKKQKKIYQLKQNISNFDFNKLNLEDLEKINDILMVTKPKNEAKPTNFNQELS